jgi:hypothetical protein
MEDRVLCIISEIQADRRQRCRLPDHVLLSAIVSIHGDRDEVVRELTRLYREGKITGGNTINDKWIKIIEQSNE